MYARYRLAWLALALLTVAPAARAAQYAGGSLIIPMQASYQDYCGTASAYGLVYNVLRANDGLVALGKSRITVHWAYNATKGSPNRCVPTNVQNPPIYGSYSAANKPPWNDPIWNDGCDFRIVDSSAVPVKLVKNTTGAPADDTLITTINTSTDTSVYPGYTSVQVQQTTNPKVTSVGYMGGPFIIAASDANLFLQLLSGTLVVKDSAGNNVDFAPFRTITSPQCSGAFAFGGATPSHNVTVHRAQVAFTADDNTSFNAPPPRVALLETWAAAAAGGGSGGGGGGGGGGSGAVSGGILDQYLLNAGLKFTGAFGCPPGGANQSTPALKAQYCPTGATGQIFDYFDVADLANGLIFATDAAGKPLYQALWTPHWDVNMTTLTTPTNKAFTQAAAGTLLAGTYYYRVSAINTMGETLASPETSLTVSLLKGVVVNWNAVTGASGYKVYGRTKGAEKYIATVLPPTQGAAVPTTYTDAGSIAPNGALPTSNTTLSPPADVIASLSNISAFLNAKTGLFAECASIETYEGESANQLAAPITTGSQFQTCVKDSVNPGACSSTSTTPFGVTRNNPSAPSSAYVQNCTDPTAASSSNCIYFPNAGDPFMQFGDYRWFNQFGLVQNYIPATGSIYKPGTVSLGFNVASLDKTKLSSLATARTMANSDEATRSLKDANPNLANILYLAGHTYDNYVAGTRIVLGTLFQLGLVYASTETGYVGPTLFNDSVFVPTYDRITSAPTSSAVKKFDWNAGSQFLFPYHSGHLKTHSLSSGLQQGNNDFAASVQWDAKTGMPKPDKRNVFTYLGGTLTTAATGLARQTGWAPVDFDYTSIQSPATTCVDKWSVGQVAANGTTGKPGPYTGMNAGSNGVCDLEEVLAANMVMGASDFGSDNGASEQAAIKTKLLDTSVGGAVQVSQQLTQLIRGFCFSTVGGKDGWGAMQANPSTTQCNFNRGDDLNTVGGFVHSQVAVVPPSGNIADLPNGKHRPTVAYAGGLDGQLHAFYVPAPSGAAYDDSGYQGPANATGLPFTSAKGVFHTNWLSTGSFTPPAALTELWAFIPPGQIPYLYSNSAMVDSSPAVIDVFGDLDGDGIREWHTVLIASAGGTNRELFALDVTNPLAPVMLWDIESTFDNVSLTYAPVPLMDDNTGQGLVVTEQAFRWRNHCRAADVSAGICTSTTFQLPPASDAGRTQSGRYNYSRLGASQSVQAALMRRNNDPVFAAFLATNEPGGNGMNLFALDISTGRKLWEFDNPYDKTTDAASSDHPKMADALDNTPPQGATLFSKAGTSLIDTVYVGDLEGSLWEIDAADGLNLNSYASKLGGSTCTGDGWCNFPLSNAFWYDPNAYPQPITTLSTIFAVPVGLPSTSPFVNYQGQPMLAYGTAGTDAVSSLSYTVTGSVHLFPLTYSGRLQSSDILGPPVQTSVARTKGLAKELAGYPQYVATGERLYGSIVAAGDHLYFATTKGTVTNIDSRGSLSGSTYSIDLGAAAGSNRSTLTSTAGGAGGTPLVGKTTSGQIRVITVTDQTINVSAAQTVALQAPAINGVGQTPTAFLGWFYKAMGHEY